MRQCEVRDIGTGDEDHPQLRVMPGIDVVGGEALAELGGGGADDVIAVGVVGGVFAEDLDADGALLDLVGLTGEGLLDDVTEEGDGAFARTGRLHRERGV